MRVRTVKYNCHGRPYRLGLFNPSIRSDVKPVSMTLFSVVSLIQLVVC